MSPVAISWALVGAALVVMVVLAVAVRRTQNRDYCRWRAELEAWVDDPEDLGPPPTWPR